VSAKLSVGEPTHGSTEAILPLHLRDGDADSLASPVVKPLPNVWVGAILVHLLRYGVGSGPSDPYLGYFSHRL